MLTLRENTRPVYAGNVKIGGGGVVIQSMCNTKTSDAKATLEQINRLYDAGCELVRLAVPDEAAAKAFDEICSKSPIPVAADIHFDYRLALLCVSNGASKIRINPGNIGNMERVSLVANACRENNIPIRIGVNLGSIEKEFEEKYGRTPKAMVESALSHIKMLEQCDFNDIVISLKASDVIKTVNAYEMLSEKVNYPLHIGITESGTAYSGIIKSSVGIGAILMKGIGDTIRVSLTAPPEEEITAAIHILKSIGLIKSGIELVSCPSCGRCKVDQVKIANAVEKELSALKTDKYIRVAVMGCAVNGPGEAKDADIGIAGGNGFSVLIKKGEIVDKIPENEVVSRLIREVKELL